MIRTNNVISKLGRWAPSAGAALLYAASPARAWDSEHNNPTHSTHTYLTDYAIAALAIEAKQTGVIALQAKSAEVNLCRDALIDGANCELHEIPANEVYVMRLSLKYGIDLEERRARHLGTNAGCDDLPGWWRDCRRAYLMNNKKRAYFYMGIILHMIEDMGVPAHAWGIIHQALPLTETDSFEAAALFHWGPDFAAAANKDPQYLGDNAPTLYYLFSQALARKESRRDQHTPHLMFGSLLWDEKTRPIALAQMAQRQAGTANVAAWALRSFVLTLNSAKTAPPISQGKKDYIEPPEPSEFACSVTVESKTRKESSDQSIQDSETESAQITGTLRVFKTVMQIGGKQNIEYLVGLYYIPGLNPRHTSHLAWHRDFQSPTLDSQDDFTGQINPAWAQKQPLVLFFYSYGFEQRKPHEQKTGFFSAFKSEDGPRPPDGWLRPDASLVFKGTWASSAQPKQAIGGQVPQPTSGRVSDWPRVESFFVPDDQEYHNKKPLGFHLSAGDLARGITSGKPFVLQGQGTTPVQGLLNITAGTYNARVTLQCKPLPKK